jgi:uncharacterized cupredoxin-like copper-binding protein
MRARGIVGFVLLATVLPMICGYGLVAAHASTGPAPLGPGLVTIELSTRYSRFSTEEIVVYQGTLVRFVVTNEDPIHHEFIVGPEEVHAAHENGHDLTHPPVPGEVSVDPGETGLTTYLFDQPGSLRYACHFPGHLAYGMQGTVRVLATP